MPKVPEYGLYRGADTFYSLSADRQAYFKSCPRTLSQTVCRQADTSKCLPTLSVDFPQHKHSAVCGHFLLTVRRKTGTFNCPRDLKTAREISKSVHEIVWNFPHSTPDSATLKQTVFCSKEHTSSKHTSSRSASVESTKKRLSNEELNPNQTARIFGYKMVNLK